MPKMSRAALLAMAVQQARKFSKTPRGQQLIAQAKQAASDPQARAQLIQQVKDRTGRGGASPAASRQPGLADPQPPSARPLASTSVASPGPVTSPGAPGSAGATQDMPQVGSIPPPPPPSVPADPTQMPPRA
jgi:hypothetical protein